MWVKISDDALDHPKLRKAGPNAVALWLAGLCYCARHLTDGLIPKDDVEDLYRPKGRRFRYNSAAKELCKWSLWCDEGDHYRVHNYHNYQPTSEEVRSKREREAERKRDFRKSKSPRKQASNASCPAGTDAGTPGGLPSDVQEESHTPSEDPVPSRPVPSSSPLTPHGDGDGAPLPTLDPTAIQVMVSGAFHSHRGSPLPNDRKFGPWASCWEDAVRILESRQDPIADLRRALATFFADPWAIKARFPPSAFCGDIGRWLPQSPPGDPPDYRPDRDGQPKDDRNMATWNAYLRGEWRPGPKLVRRSG